MDEWKDYYYPGASFILNKCKTCRKDQKSHGSKLTWWGETNSCLKESPFISFSRSVLHSISSWRHDTGHGRSWHTVTIVRSSFSVIHQHIQWCHVRVFSMDNFAICDRYCGHALSIAASSGSEINAIRATVPPGLDELKEETLQWCGPGLESPGISG